LGSGIERPTTAAPNIVVPTQDSDDAEMRASEFEAGLERPLENLRALRNMRGHPDGLALSTPGTSYMELELGRDLIAQLFSALAPSAAAP